jgi:L-lactate dehydrogenase
MNQEICNDSFTAPTLRVAVVGAGNVGSTFAYALMLSGLATEIVLIDANHAKAEGEAMDLNHGVPLASPARFWAGEYSDCAGAAVTVVTAGSAQRRGKRGWTSCSATR